MTCVFNALGRERPCLQRQHADGGEAHLDRLEIFGMRNRFPVFVTYLGVSPTSQSLPRGSLLACDKLHETKKRTQKQTRARKATSSAVRLSPQRLVLLSGCTCSPFRRAINFASTMLTCNTRSCFAGRSSMLKRAPTSASAPNISAWRTLRVWFEVQHRLRIPMGCAAYGSLIFLKRNTFLRTRNHQKQQVSALVSSQ